MSDRIDEKFIYTELFPEENQRPTKGQRTRLQIVFALIEWTARNPFDQLNFRILADVAGVSRATIDLSFKSTYDVLAKALEYIRIHFQSYGISELKKAKTQKSQLSTYVRTNIDWVEEYPTHANVATLGIYYSGIDPSIRKTRSELNLIAIRRIESMIHLDLKSNRHFIARHIHSLITGSVLALISEEASMEPEKLKRSLTRTVLSIAGHK